LVGVKRAARKGLAILKRGGTSLDAVEAAVICLEDDPVFNAGTGSALNLRGEVEMDAAIMNGRNLEGAGVAVVRHVKNPIRLARIVMERTNHVLLAGEGAAAIATAYALPQTNVKIRNRIEAWRRSKLALRRDGVGYFGRNASLIREDVLRYPQDTVGALALDRRANLAAACSTGGVSMKLPGRVGDSAILGAGLYADNNSGAATATGIGEIAVRLAVSKVAVDLMTRLPAEEAAREAIRITGKRIGRGLGILTLDNRGRFGIAHDTPNICWAANNKKRFQTGMTGKRLRSESQEDF
jgi:L-asparaginase / beta-aspartyl-peptidase